MTIAERKEREKEQRRKDILDTAEKLFYAMGYDEVAMEDIAKRAELNKATIYLYFKNKDALFMEVILRGLKRLQTKVLEIKNDKDSRRELTAIWDANIAFFRDDPDFSRIYGSFIAGRFQVGDGMAVEMTPYHTMNFADLDKMMFASEPLREIIRIRQELVLRTQEVIHKGMRIGAITGGKEPMEMAIMFHLLMENACRINQDHRMALAGAGIDEKRFVSDLREQILSSMFC